MQGLLDVVDEVGLVAEDVLVEGLHENPADEVAVGGVHLLLFEEVLQHLGDVLAGQVDFGKFALVCVGGRVHGRWCLKEPRVRMVFLRRELLSRWIGPLLLSFISFGDTISFSRTLSPFILKNYYNQPHC